ncbi:hypothetical protein ACIHEI_09630 [Kitasatospora sp. NPDC051984]|uniref:hypothetical protein n=1 Tax=unclassified Kitasatospora TaxID=2633591 RepID=UPI003717169F
MRALTRTVAALGLAAPVLLGCAGLAFAGDGGGIDEMGDRPEAHFVDFDFAANEDVAALAFTASFVSPDGVEHASGVVVASDEGVFGGATDAGASW